MSERKTRLKNHIKAAREWLCKAEDSLDKDNSIQGDLNLMLAQAELQRAKESGQSQQKKKSHWSVRLAPAVAAVLLVVVGSQFWPHVFATRVSPAVVKTVAEEPVKPAGTATPVRSEINTGVVSTPAVSGQQPEIVMEKAVSIVTEEKPMQLPPSKDQSIAMEAGTTQQQEAKIPPADMQKLMRAAGKTLRAQ